MHGNRCALPAPDARSSATIRVNNGNRPYLHLRCRHPFELIETHHQELFGRLITVNSPDTTLFGRHVQILQQYFAYNTAKPILTQVCIPNISLHYCDHDSRNRPRSPPHIHRHVRKAHVHQFLHYSSFTETKTRSSPKHENEQRHSQYDHEPQQQRRKIVRGHKHHPAAGILEEVCGSGRWRLWEDVSVDQLRTRIFPREIRPNRFRELHYSDHSQTIRQISRVGIVGYRRAGRVRPTPTVVIPRDRSSLRLFRHRLSELAGKCHGQVVPRSPSLLPNNTPHPRGLEIRPAHQANLHRTPSHSRPHPGDP